jgi:hypothetical protein
VALTGCNKNNPEKEPLTLDQDFSVNVMQVPTYWPREKMDWPEDALQARTQQEAWARHGTPDFLRMVYTYDNRVVRPIELDPSSTLAGARPAPLVQWIYIDDDKTLLFRDDRVIEGELDDIVETVCMLGDPAELDYREQDGVTRTRMMYYNRGQELIFYDGVLAEKRQHPALPGWGMNPKRRHDQ